MAAFFVPKPDSAWPGYKKIAMLVDLHPIRHAIIFAAGFLPQKPSLRNRSVLGEVIPPDVALFAVVHVEVFAVRREGQAVRLREFAGKQGHVRAILAEPIDALKRNFLGLPLRQVEAGIGEIKCTVRAADEMGTIM